MKSPTMLYRCPGPLEFEGVSCETTIVDEEGVEAALAEGWHHNWNQACEAAAAEKLAANEAEQAEIARKLAAAGAGTGLQAVHKGRGVWAVVDADGVEVHTGLTKEDALAKAGAPAGG